MSIKVAILVSDSPSPCEWAKFSDQVLSKSLDWNLVTVTPADRRSVIEAATGYVVQSHETAIWSYEVSPIMLIDDLLIVLKDIACMGYPVAVAHSWVGAHSGLNSDPIHFCYDANTDQWELTTPKEMLAFWQKSQVSSYL